MSTHTKVVLFGTNRDQARCSEARRADSTRHILRGRCLLAAMLLWLGAGTGAQAQTNFFWTNLVDGVWSVGSNWTNNLGTVAAPVAGGNVDYSIFLEGGLWPRHTQTVDVLTDSKFTLNRFVNSAYGTNIITNATAGTYLVFSANSSGGLPQLLQNSTNSLRFGIGIMLTNDLTVGGTGSGAVYLDKDLAGTNALTKAGTYTLFLRASNSFSGLVTIQSGILQIENNMALRNAPTIDVQNTGQLLINVAGNTFTNAITIVGNGDGNNGALRFALGGIRWSGPITLGGDSRISVYRNGSTTVTNAGVISGTGNLTFFGRGNNIANQQILILEATNTYAGNTTILSGSQGETFTVRLAGANLLPTGTVLTLNNTATNMARFDLNANDQTIAGLATAGTGQSNVVANMVAGLSRLTINNVANYTYGGFMTGNIQVIKSGVGVQTFSGTNTYLGGTIISNGLLRFQNDFSLPASGTITLASNTASVAYNVAGGLAGTLFAKIVDIASTPGAIALTTNTAADTINFLTYTNLYLGAAENVTNSGAYTPFQLGGGTLTNYFNLGGGAAGAVLTFTNDIVDGYNGGGQSVVTIGGSSVARAVVELTGANTYSGGTFLNGGVLSVGSDNNLGAAGIPVTFGGGVLRITGTTLTNLDSRPMNWSTFNGGFDVADAANVFTITNVIGGSTGFLKLGPGVLALLGANTFGGDLAVQGGVLRAEWGAGIPLADNLVLTGGVWETSSGLITNNLGPGAGEIQLPGSTGGFSAITAPLTVNLGGAGAPVTWGSAYFKPSVLVLNETTADQPLNFLNPIDFSNAIRTIAVNANTATLAGVANAYGTIGLTKLGAGTLLLTNTTPMTWGRAVTVSNGTLWLSAGTTNNFAGANVSVNGAGQMIVDGPMDVGGNNFYVGGGGAGDRSVAFISTNVNATIFQVGQAASSVGAVYQTGGVVRVTSTANSDVFALGVGAGSYGYYRMTDGQLISGSRFSIAPSGAGAFGVFDLMQGYVSVAGAANAYLMLGRSAGGAGVLNIFGGRLDAGNSQDVSINFSTVGFGMLNVGGPTGAVANLALNAARSLNVNRTANGTGIVNVLSGGTLIANRVYASAAGASFVNFDGGTLQANPNGVGTLGTGFLSGLSGVYIYDGGATIDSGTNILTISTSLLAPTGKGVVSVTTNGLAASQISGYIGAPVVQITGGNGVGASAIAQIDVTTGILTNILVTSAGSGYLLGDVLTVTLFGGGNTNVILGDYTLADNATTGGLTKDGTGALFLPANNTYGGPTLINAGGLLLADTNTSISANTLTLAGITSAIGPTNVLEQSFLDWLASRVSGVVTGAVLLAANSDSNLVFGGTLTNVFLGGLNDAVYTGGATWADNTLRLGNGPGAFVFGSAIGAGTNLVIGPVGGNPLSLVLLTNVNSQDSTLINSGTLAVSNDFSLGTAGAGITFNGGNFAAFGTTNLVVAGRAITFAADAIIGGSNVTFTDTADLGGVTRTLAISNAVTSIEGTVSNGGLIKEGRGTLLLAGNNTYAGGTWLNAGILSVSNANALSSGNITFNGGILFGFGQAAVTITQFLDFAGIAYVGAGSNITFNKTVDLAGSNQTFNISNALTTISSVIQNGALRKAGPGVLSVTANNTYTGGTFIAGGTLSIDADASLGAVPASLETNVFFTANSTLLFAGNFAINTNRIITVQSGVTGDLDVTNRTITLGNTFTGAGTLRVNASNGTLILTGTDAAALTIVRNNSNTTLVLSNVSGAAVLGNLQVGNAATTADAWLYTAAPNQFGTNSVLSFSIGTGRQGHVQLLGNDQTIAGLSYGTATRGVVQNTDDETGYGNAILTISNNANYTFNSVMRDTLSGSGTLGLTKDGPATQILAGVGISYTGPTTIRGGTLYLSNTTVFASSVVTNDTSLLFDLTAGNVLAYTGAISGAGTLTKEGIGVLVLTGSDNYTGNTLVNNGILQADFGVGLPASSLLVLTGGTVSGLSGSFTNPIGNTAAHIQFVDGVAGGFSAYNTPLTVNLNNDGSTQQWGSANFNPSVLILNDTVANTNLTFVNGLDLNGATRTITVKATNMGIAATVSGIINNSGGPGTADLRKTGPGVLALTGNNVFGSSIFVEEGVLRAEWGAGIPGTVNLVLTGGVWETASGLIDSNLGTGAGQIQLPGSTGGFSAVTTPLTVNLGGAASQIPWGTVIFNPSVLLLNAASASATLTFTNGLDLNGVNRTIAVNSDLAFPVTITGIIINSSGIAGLMKAGPGLLVLPTTTTNYYNGNIHVQGGVLRAEWGSGMPSTANLVLTGGVWETASGSFTASLGTGAGQVQLPASTGGFSAITTPLTVNLDGGATLVWGTNTFSPSVLALNAATADQPLNFDNLLEFSNAIRTIAVNASTATLAGVVNAYGTIGLTKTGSGTLLLTNSTPVTWGRTVTVGGGTLWLAAGTTNNFAGGSVLVDDGGVFNVNGPISSTTNIRVGVTAGARAVMNIGTNVAIARSGTSEGLRIGIAGAGAVYQTGGVVTITGGLTNEYALGLGSGGYAFYGISGGELNVENRFSMGVTATSPAVFEQWGGTVTIGEWIMHRGDAPAVINVFGGQFNAGNLQDIALCYDQVGYGVLNVGGFGSVTANLAITNTRSLNVGRTTGSTGIVNVLSGGTLIANRVYSTAASGVAVVNFNGGTLKANPGDGGLIGGTTLGGTFMTNLNAYIFPGGATIDTDTNIVTVSAPLLAPTGFGVSSITTNGLSPSEIDSYIGPPVVMISGGSGEGASAIAQIDPLTGLLTNVFVTSAGSGYGAADVLTITLLGGGNTNVILGNYSLASNASGGLTKKGAGTLILAGTNTYTGPTVLNAGSIQVGSGGSSGTLDNGLIFGAYTFTNNGSLIYNRTDTNTAANNITGTGNLIVLGSGSGQLNLAGTNDFSGGSAVTNGLLMFTHFGALPTLGSITLDSGVVGLNTNNVAANLLPRLAANPSGYIALFLTNASDTIDFAGGGYSGLGLASAEDLTYNGLFTPYVANGTNNWWLGALAGTTFTFTNLINDGGSASPLRIGSNALPGLAGVVALRPQQPNTYSGGTFLHGGVLNITNDNALGAVPPSAVTNITFATNATFQFGADLNLNPNRTISILSGTGTFDTLANTAVIPGAIVGDGVGSMNKVGSGMLVLDSNTDVVQFLTVNAGTLWLSNTLFTVTGIKANGAIIVGDTAADNNATMIVDTNSVVGMTAGTNNPFTIGNLGSGNTLIVTNGGVVYAGTTNYPGFWLGNQAVSSNNLAIVIGTNSLIASPGRVLVGDDGSWNTMMILNGGTVSNANWFEVGRTATASNNLLVVSGERSLLSNTVSGIIVGEAGVGNTVIITNGARVVTGGRLVLGYGTGANSNATYVGGAGTLLNVASHIQIGSNGSFNTLAIGNSATVTVVSLFVVGAAAAADNNAAIITDTGTVVSVVSETRIGDSGSGNTMMVLTGATFNAASWVQAGRLAGATNNLLLVSGAGALLSNSVNGILIGNAGSQNVGIFTNGAYVVTPILGLGWSPADSDSNAVYIGGSGTRVLAFGRGIQIGTNGSFNTMGVGDGAVVSARTNISVGMLGSGNRLTISGGAVVSNSSDGVFVGRGSSTVISYNNLLTVDGGTLSNAAGSIMVGNYGVGNAAIFTNAARVFTPGFIVGNQTAGNSNMAAIGGASTLLQVGSSGIAVGTNGSFNTISVGNAAVVTNLGLLQIGSVNGSSNNTLIVSGADTRLYSQGEIYVGATNTHGNVMQILDGAVVTNNSFFFLGRGAGSSNNTLIVDNATLLNGRVLAVGGVGIGNVAIFTNGARVATPWLDISRSTGSGNNSAFISGAGTLVRVATNVQIGASVASSSNLLAVSDNSVLRVGSNVIVGGDAANTGFENQFVVSGGATGIIGGDLVISTNSALRNLSGGTVMLGRHFDNLSTNLSQNDFSGTFIFNGTSGGAVRTQFVEIASVLKGLADMASTNFFFGTLQAGDPGSGSNAFLQLVDNRSNTAGIGSELLAVSNLVVATANSVLDLNNMGVFAVSLYNTGTVQQVGAGISRVDVVNTFTNLGNVVAAAGGVLHFSNAFINALQTDVTRGVRLAGGTLTNFTTGGVLTNYGSIGGGGLVNPVIGNEGIIVATNLGAGGTLTLASGFSNSGTGPVNAGLLAALGSDGHLQIAQSFTNAGRIWVNNDAAAVTVTDVSSNLYNAGIIEGRGIINAFVDNAGIVSNGIGGLLTFNLALNNRAAGTVGAYNGSIIVFNGAMTNAGTMTAKNGSVLQFNNGLTLSGSGSLMLDPSTSIINGTLTLGPASILSLAATDDVLVMRGDFANGSTNNMTFDTRNGTMTFGTSGPVTNTFEVAGRNLGTNFAGFDNNFALGTLNVTNHIAFVDNINNLTGGASTGTNEVLYLDFLHLFSGATMKISQLTIYVGKEFVDDNISATYSTGVINAGNNVDPLNIFFENGGQIVFIPEPSTAALLLLGVGALAGWRRRRTAIRHGRPGR